MAKEKVQKFTKEEMDSISEIRNEASQIFAQLGQIHIQRRNVMAEIEQRELENEQRHDALVQKESSHHCLNGMSTSLMKLLKLVMDVVNVALK